MKMANIICFVALILAGNALALQPEASPENASLDKPTDHSEDTKFEHELKAFQEIQREGQFMKLRLKNKDLMDKLGINDRSDIFDDANDKSTKKINNSIFLLATFKKGNGPIKARVFIPGKGMVVIKKGDIIQKNIKILDVKDRSAEIMIISGGDIYTVEPSVIF